MTVKVFFPLMYPTFVEFLYFANCNSKMPRTRSTPSSTPVRCSRCRQLLLPSEFDLNPRNGTFLKSCRPCTTARSELRNAQRTRNACQVAVAVARPHADGKPTDWILFDGVETVLYDDSGDMTELCTYCGAMHWMEERV